MIFDGHNDALLAVYLPERGHDRKLLERSEHGHLDLPRAREGGMAGGMFAIFVPSPPTGEPESARRIVTAEGYEWKMSPPLDPAYARQHTDAMIALLHDAERDSGGMLRIARTVAEIEACTAAGITAAVIHFEGAEAIEADLSNLREYYDRGLRSIGITWSRHNAFGHGVPFKFPGDPDTGAGLTARGKALVHACNEMGIIIDVAHLNARGFWDVAEHSAAPLVASHSNAHAICPHVRNLTDAQLDAIARSGGVVGVNYAVIFLRPDAKNDPDTPLDAIVRHIDYIARRIGVDHVALGSDFDGATIPRELRDAAGLPRLINALRQAGYNDDQLRKIAHANWLRVLKQSLRA